ncbi:MAG: AraC family transcriptional regulator [Pirellulaceae bacterium]
MQNFADTTPLKLLLAQAAWAEVLFDSMDDIVFFVKDQEGRYCKVNQTLVTRCGLKNKSELIGKTAIDVFPKPLGENYLAQDLRILQSGEAIHDELELHVYSSGENGWCLTSKIPLLNDSNTATIGLVGLSRDLRILADDPDEDFASVAKAVNFAQTNLGSELSNEQLAQIAGLSAYRLDKRIRRVFQLTTGQMILKFRMERASELLRNSDLPIASVALETGYSDQSAFSRQFRRTMGSTPADYRKSHQ